MGLRKLANTPSLLGQSARKPLPLKLGGQYSQASCLEIEFGVGLDLAQLFCCLNQEPAYSPEKG